MLRQFSHTLKNFDNENSGYINIRTAHRVITASNYCQSLGLNKQKQFNQQHNQSTTLEQHFLTKLNNAIEYVTSDGTSKAVDNK